jgi:WS/DGAT/MGAT family acyltransferase
MERLSAQDASFVYLENKVNHMSIAALGILEGPAPASREIENLITSKLHRVPRLRQRLRLVPLDLGFPVWCDDPQFELSNHVFREQLPAPGSEDQLQALAGQIMSQQLDRSRPLWELWVVDGLAGGEWAFLLKLHHCLADGVAATELLDMLLEKDPEAVPGESVPWQPEAEPGSLELASSAMSERMAMPRRGWKALRSAFRAPGETARKAGDFVDGLVSLRRPTNLELESSLNGPLGENRSWRWTRTTLADIKKIRQSHGGTVNDVVLAVIARGFRALLLSRGEPVENFVVRSLVPVSVRRDDERDIMNNRVSSMFAELHVGIEDPVECLVNISQQMARLKKHHQAAAAETLSSLSALAPPALMALGTRLSAGVDTHAVQTVTTNVPGPTHALYMTGCRMRIAYLYVPLAVSMRIGVAMFSYHGQLTFAVTADRDHAPDTDILCQGIDAGIAELLAVS